VGVKDGSDSREANGHPYAADKKERLSSQLSMRDIPNNVAARFISPMSTVCRELDSWLKPAEAKMVI